MQFAINQSLPFDASRFYLRILKERIARFIRVSEPRIQVDVLQAGRQHSAKEDEKQKRSDSVTVHILITQDRLKYVSTKMK